MKRNYFVVQFRSKTEPYRYRAQVFAVEGNWNLLRCFDASRPNEETITVNCWPKNVCEKTASEWNDEFKKQGRYLDF